MNHWEALIFSPKERSDIVTEISVLKCSTYSLKETEKYQIFMVIYHTENKDVFLNQLFLFIIFSSQT